MNVEKYIQYRTGATEISTIVRNMFIKPFFSNSLRSFWKYWNPGFGYYLLYYCFKPLRKIFPNWISILLTFLICGLLHDAIFVIPLMIMNSSGFIFPFITVWFLTISIGILITELVHIDFKKTNNKIRPLLHIGYLIGTFCLTRYFDLLFG